MLAIEYLVGASPEWFAGQRPGAAEKYFADALRWVAQRHGADNVVAWAVHRDESTPHLICYVVPLDPQTGRLNARRWLGGRQKLSQMQTEFATNVGQPSGLERGIEGSRATHQRVQQWYGQITRPDPHVSLSPQDVLPRQGETAAMLADRLSTRFEAELKPTFSAAKTARSAKKRAEEMASTAKAYQRLNQKLVRLCAPVLELYRIDQTVFDEIMEWTQQRLRRMRLEANVRLARARAQSCQQSAIPGRQVSHHDPVPTRPTPSPPQPVPVASGPLSDVGWGASLDR